MVKGRKEKRTLKGGSKLRGDFQGRGGSRGGVMGLQGLGGGLVGEKKLQKRKLRGGTQRKRQGSCLGGGKNTSEPLLNKFRLLGGPGPKGWKKRCTFRGENLEARKTGHEEKTRC